MQSLPDVVVLLHLHDVVHDVALVMFEPDIQAKLAGRHLSVPVRFRPLESNEQLIRRLPQAADNIKRFPYALMTIS